MGGRERAHSCARAHTPHAHAHNPPTHAHTCMHAPKTQPAVNNALIKAPPPPHTHKHTHACTRLKHSQRSTMPSSKRPPPPHTHKHTHACTRLKNSQRSTMPSSKRRGGRRMMSPSARAREGGGGQAGAWAGAQAGGYARGSPPPLPPPTRPHTLRIQSPPPPLPHKTPKADPSKRAPGLLKPMAVAGSPSVTRLTHSS